MVQEETRSLAGCLNNVRWVPIPSHADSRGVLSVIEGGIDVPFPIERVYFLHDVQEDRGGHAHRDTRQLVVAVSGSCRLTLSDGAENRHYTLDDSGRGLLLVPMLFIQMDSFSPGTVVMVLASTHYDKKRSLRSWEEYLEAIRS